MALFQKLGEFLIHVVDDEDGAPLFPGDLNKGAELPPYLIVHHMNKAIGQKAINRAVGSVDIVGAARSVLLVARTDREHPDERILAQVKCNVGPTGSAIVFSVDGGAVQWLEETARTADEVLGNVFANLGRPDRKSVV